MGVDRKAIWQTAGSLALIASFIVFLFAPTLAPAWLGWAVMWFLVAVIAAVFLAALAFLTYNIYAGFKSYNEGKAPAVQKTARQPYPNE